MQDRAPIYEEGGYDYYTGRPDDLRRLSEMRNWQIAAGEPDVTGWPVIDSEGIQVGTVDDLLADTQSREVIFVVLKYAKPLVSGAQWTLVPVDMMNYGSREPVLRFAGVADDLRNAPKFDYTGCDVEGYRAYYDYWVSRSPIGRGMPDAITEPVMRLVIEPRE